MTRPPDGRESEAVLSQALRAMAGGRRDPGAGAAGPADAGANGSDAGDSGGLIERLTTAQILLIAAIIGLAVGMSAAFTVLLL